MCAYVCVCACVCVAQLTVSEQWVAKATGAVAELARVQHEQRSGETRLAPQLSARHESRARALGQCPFVSLYRSTGRVRPAHQHQRRRRRDEDNQEQRHRA